LPLKYVTKTAIILSFFIGFFLTLLVAIADIYLFSDLVAVISSAKLLSLLILINAVVIAIEFWLLFHVGFQVVAVYVLKLEQKLQLDHNVKASLIRAVLELNEPNSQSFGLNPFRGKKKYYWITLLFYKFKVILSNVISKVIIRKLLSRSSLRIYAPLISTIITGWWDAWVQSAVLKEVRYRLSGRLYIVNFINNINQQELGPYSLESLIRLVAVRIELFGDYNNNLDYFIVQIDRCFPDSVRQTDKLFDIKLLKNSYQKCSIAEQTMIADVACHIILLKNRKLSIEEKSLLDFFNITDAMIEQQRNSHNSINALV